jgi:hypothetical protein
MEEPNLRLTSRQENTRCNEFTPIIRFHLSEIFKHFSENIASIQAQFAVADELYEKSKVDECENIWRSQIVFLESAFDFYLHEIVKYGLCEIFCGNWNQTEKYKNITVQMKTVTIALSENGNKEWFLKFINEMYKVMTLTSFLAVKDQMNLLGIDIKSIADRAFYQQGSTVQTKEKLKQRIEELFKRRNAIAHQSDRNHADAQKNSIKKDIVLEFISDIEKIVDAIHKIVAKKSDCCSQESDR